MHFQRNKIIVQVWMVTLLWQGVCHAACHETSNASVFGHLSPQSSIPGSIPDADFSKMPILVLEDMEMLVEIAQDMLTYAGFTKVSIVKSMKEGRAIIPEILTFRLGLFDFNVPGGNGVELALECLESNPNFCVIFTSSYERGILGMITPDQKAKIEALEKDHRVFISEKNKVWKDLPHILPLLPDILSVDHAPLVPLGSLVPPTANPSIVPPKGNNISA